MTVWVVYDSRQGNTEFVAQAIGRAVATAGTVRLLRAAVADPAAVASGDLLFVGSPTLGGRPTPPTWKYVTSLALAGVSGVTVAAFDTRLPGKFPTIFGYAAVRMAGLLRANGAFRVLPPEGFFVKASAGPLLDGELERAAGWAARIAGSAAAAGKAPLIRPDSGRR